MLYERGCSGGKRNRKRERQRKRGQWVVSWVFGLYAGKEAEKGCGTCERHSGGSSAAVLERSQRGMWTSIEIVRSRSLSLFEEYCFHELYGS